MNLLNFSTARFWFSFLSVVNSIISLLLATLILTYLTPVPPKGVVEYLVFIHFPFSLCALTFILSVLLQGAAQLTVIHSYIGFRDFWIAVAILLATYIALIVYFAIMDGWSKKNNERFYNMWLEENSKKDRNQCQTEDDLQE